jgi:hypothetical protein
MLIPLAVKSANALLISSKFTHDLAVDASVNVVGMLHSHPDSPPLVQKLIIGTISNTLLWGDEIGNLMVRLYVFLLNL